MNNLNQILIEGQVVELGTVEKTDGEVKFRFSVETVRKTKDEERANWFKIVATGPLAEQCGLMLDKGRGVRVVGRLDHDENDNACIVADHVIFKPEGAKK